MSDDLLIARLKARAQMQASAELGHNPSVELESQVEYVAALRLRALLEESNNLKLGAIMQAEHLGALCRVVASLVAVAKHAPPDVLMANARRLAMAQALVHSVETAGKSELLADAE